jgi:multisubunit Na+/H+ antiporter MnhB subunit
MPTSGLREKPKRTPRVIAVIAVLVWAALIFAASHIPGSGFPAHPSFLNVVAHFCEYAVFAALLALALHSPGRALWKTALFALVIASLYAVSDEFHQSFIPGRTPDPLDWLTDTLGALLGSVVTIWVLSAQKVKQSRTRDANRASRK